MSGPTTRHVALVPLLPLFLLLLRLTTGHCGRLISRRHRRSFLLRYRRVRLRTGSSSSPIHLPSAIECRRRCRRPIAITIVFIVDEVAFTIVAGHHYFIVMIVETIIQVEMMPRIRAYLQSHLSFLFFFGVSFVSLRRDEKGGEGGQSGLREGTKGRHLISLLFQRGQVGKVCTRLFSGGTEEEEEEEEGDEENSSSLSLQSAWPGFSLCLSLFSEPFALIKQHTHTDKHTRTNDSGV